MGIWRSRVGRTGISARLGFVVVATIVGIRQTDSEARGLCLQIGSFF
jgi:hypothetical protein